MTFLETPIKSEAEMTLHDKLVKYRYIESTRIRGAKGYRVLESYTERKERELSKFLCRMQIIILRAYLRRHRYDRANGR